MPYTDLNLKKSYMERSALRRRGEYKVCIKCGENKHEKEFMLKRDRPRQRNRRSSYCHPCRKIYNRENMWKRKYNLTPLEYKELFDKQKGKCAICDQESWRLCVDHHHVSNKVRSLLCVSCNTMIGSAFENPDILQRAINYLSD